MKLLIYVPLLSPRIKYIFSFIFNDILKAEIDLTVNVEEFSRSALPKMCYAKYPIGEELFFKSANLLFEHKITAQHIGTTNFGELKVPFPVMKSSLPFDIFAASFYFLSRYEEYTYFENEKTELYPFKNSLQYRLKLLKLPIIDNWALILKNILLKQFPELTFGNKCFFFKTVHIHPTKKLNRYGFISNTFNRITSIVNKVMNVKADKLRSIQQAISDLERYGFVEKPIYVLADQLPEHRFIAELHIPKSYIKLSKQRTENDYSMLYPNYPGFRAGTCTSFYWYDLQLEKKTQLLIHPVATTDIALLNNKTEEALLLQINELISSVKLVNGDFHLLSLYNDIRPQ